MYALRVLAKGNREECVCTSISAKKSNFVWLQVNPKLFTRETISVSFTESVHICRVSRFGAADNENIRLKGTLHLSRFQDFVPKFASFLYFATIDNEQLTHISVSVDNVITHCISKVLKEETLKWNLGIKMSGGIFRLISVINMSELAYPANISRFYK